MPEQDTRGEHEVDLTLAFFAGVNQSAFPASLPSYILVEHAVATGGSSPRLPARIMPDCACK